jgi:hypothetical protein
VIGEKSENVLADGVGVVGVVLRFDGEEEFGNAGGDEGNEEGCEVNDEVL